MPQGPADALVGVYILQRNENVYTNDYISIIQNHQKVERAQVSINWWTDKKNMVSSYNGI